MSKHTPGPWTWGDDYWGLYGSGPDNEVLSDATYENMWLSFGNKREANGRLIAAAPDMLAALREIAATVVYAPEGGHEEVAECVRIARCAIAKATGESA